MATPGYYFNGVTQLTRNVTRFHANLFEMRSDINRDLRHSLAQLRTTFGGRAVSSKVQDRQKERERQRELADGFSREVFATLYDEAPELDRPAADTGFVQKCHETIATMAEFQTLRQQVKGDPDLAALATGKLVDAVAEAIPAMREEERKQIEQSKQTARERRRDRSSKADPEGAMRRILRKAVQSAADSAASVANGLNGIKPGLGSAPAAHDHEDTGRMELAARVMGDPRLQKVMQIAGRLQRQSAAKKLTKGKTGCTTMVGVELGDDLTRVLPSELATMRPGSKLRLLTLARFAERRLQQYKMSGEDPLGRGPITILLDESGSMRGECSEWAAAIALACIGIASREKRSCTVIGFNGSVRYVVQLDDKGRAWNHTGSRIDKLGYGGASDIAIHVATSSPYGGTNFDAPFRRALRMKDGAINERADLIFVTDGCATASADIQSQVAEAKKELGLRVFGLTVGGGSLGRDVRQLCDRTIDLDKAIRSNDKHARIADALP